MEGTQQSWDVRGPDVDTIFATNFTSDRCLDALARASAKFDPSFPGWPLYRRLITGDNLLDRTLEAYAVGMARAVSRAVKSNGRAVVPRGTRRNGWVERAGLDGLNYALTGKFPAPVSLRAATYGVSDEPFRRVRDVVAAGIWIGADTYAAEVRYEFCRKLRNYDFS